jgi:uncharacterized protein
MYHLLAQFILRMRLPILGVIALVSLVSLGLVPRLGFNFTPQQLFRSADNSHEYREVFAERFGREDNLVVVLVEGPDVFSSEVMTTLRDMTYELRLVEGVKDAQSIATIAVPRPGEFPGSMSTEPLLGDLEASAGAEGLSRPVRGPPIDSESLTALAELARSEPLIASRLVSDDGTLAPILVWIDESIQDITDISVVVRALQKTFDDYPLPPDYAYATGGVPSLRVEIVDSLRREQLTFVPFTGLIYFLVLLLLFRRPAGYLLPLGTVAIALVTTVAVMVLTDYPINIINNVLPMLVFVIGISDSIHMLTRQAEEIEGGRSHGEAIIAMVRHTGVACLLTTGTTAVGFLSLTTARTEILQNFGWQAAMGVMFAYLATLFFLPAALTFLQPARRILTDEEGRRKRIPLLELGLMRMGRIVLKHPWTVVTLSLVLTGLAAYSGSKVPVDTTLLEVFTEKHPNYISTKTIEAKLGGFLPVEVSLEADEFDRFKDPDLFAKLHALQQFAARQPEVLSSESLVDYHQAARAALLGDPNERDVLPESREQIEQIHLLLTDAPDSREGVGRFITGDFRNARVLIRVGDVGARALLGMSTGLEETLAELFPEDSGVRYHITGDAYVASAALDSFIRDLGMSLVLAIGIIFVMMILVFRSLTFGLLSLLPNCMPLILTIGYMSLVGIDLNTTTIIIFAISLGIAVDDSIHFFARFKEELPLHDDVGEAILATYFGAGRAILLTSALLLTGLAILTLSSFLPTRQFGLLTGMTIAGAIIADLILLPALLYLVYGRKRKAPQSAAPREQLS